MVDVNATTSTVTTRNKPTAEEKAAKLQERISTLQAKAAAEAAAKLPENAGVIASIREMRSGLTGLKRRRTQNGRTLTRLKSELEDASKLDGELVSGISTAEKALAEVEAAAKAKGIPVPAQVKAKDAE
jgi:hypothetical protein